jgi:hypothetical protein
MRRRWWLQWEMAKLFARGRGSLVPQRPQLWQPKTAEQGASLTIVR